MDIVVPGSSDPYAEPVLGIDLGRELARSCDEPMVVDVTTPETYAASHGYEYDPHSPMMMLPVLSDDDSSSLSSLESVPSTSKVDDGADKIEFVQEWKMDLDQDEVDDWRNRIPESPRIYDADCFDEF